MRRIRLLGALRQDQLPAYGRAKSVPQSKRGTEIVFDCVVTYKESEIRILPLSYSYMKVLSLPNPIPHRTVAAGVKPRKTLVGTEHTDSTYGSMVPDAYWMNYHTNTYYSVSFSGGALISTAYEWLEYWVYGGGGTGYYFTGSDGSSLTAMREAIRTAISSGDAAAHTQVRASSGEVLTSVARAFTGNAAAAHYDQYVTNNSMGMPWSGGSWVPVFDVHDGTQAPAGTYDAGLLSFEVPEDCFNTDEVAVPSYPVGADPHPSWWQNLWADAAEQNAARRVAWKKKNTIATIDLLKNGQTPAEWDMALKRAAPRSQEVNRKYLMIETVSDDAVVTTYPDATTTVQVYTRRVKLEYNHDVTKQDGTVEVKHEVFEFVSTKTVTTTQYLQTPQLYETLAAFSTTRTGYSNWYVKHLEDAPFTWLSHVQLEDSISATAKGLGLVWNGVVDSAVGLGLTPMPIHIPDTSLHSTPAPSFIRDLITTPGDLKYDIDLTSSVHPFVEQYLRDVPQRLVSSGASPLWCNTTVAAGTTATVILYAPYVNGESMGCYNTDWPSGAKTVVLGKGVLSFSSTTGKFESSGWTDLKDKDGNPVILNVTPTSESDDFDGNALVFFSTAWKDVIDDSKAQKASYTDFQRAVIGAFS